ncbi:hypothetical protein VOLCADRAFT_94611 [Volvox carteri f. nagariensis]|uniref:Uncharacterized protein n=1 Tax=Volvox carteri f. nagariensis TaxID=3068 RepID=D8U591_VOLCA|nr:uncharacterized protein VOLCADRAFT_94611 [Volvox carteri f. nagariensis]EFJ45171.1 hypothetical protein VOLCADRAFT_94611 [Volvox carteri f. nagariensis]|eukprot:XP_002953847.1 hypothetical protein VOLCADRAFT_94611 [Volvox carteri f. nagariensis]
MFIGVAIKSQKLKRIGCVPVLYLCAWHYVSRGHSAHARAVQLVQLDRWSGWAGCRTSPCACPKLASADAACIINSAAGLPSLLTTLDGAADGRKSQSQTGMAVSREGKNTAPSNAAHAIRVAMMLHMPEGLLSPGGGPWAGLFHRLGSPVSLEPLRKGRLASKACCRCALASRRLICRKDGNGPAVDD